MIYLGKGNISVRGDYEGLYYVDYESFNNDVDLWWEYYEKEIVQDFIERFESFAECNEWVTRDRRAVAENSLYYLAIEDNEWSVAIELIQKDNNYQNIEGFQKQHFKSYYEGLRDILFGYFDSLGIYCGAWTSGIIHKKDYFKEETRIC